MHHIYILKLISRLIPDENWTEADNKIVERHFYRLQDLKKEGKLILAGRTTQGGEDQFGIVILKADEEEARKLMNEDPAVKEGIMTAELYPYSVALIDENNV